MNLIQLIKELANEEGISLAELERRTGLSSGSITKWGKSSPSADKLQKIADHFDVSVDYLLGRTSKRNYYDLTERDELDIQKELQMMIDDLSKGGALSFSKDSSEMSDQTREALIISLENSLRIAKIEAKKKFTPKKYRD